MGQIKNEYGLTPQQEKFCHEVIRGEYSADGKGVLVTAYRAAYNCKSDDGKATKSQWENASRLASNSKVRARIKQLREEREKLLSLSHAEYVSKDVWLDELDVLELMKYDESKGVWRLRRVHEMSKEIRKRVPFEINSKGIMVPVLDKNKVRERLMRALGFASDKQKLEVKGLPDVGTELKIGFGDKIIKM